MPVVTPVPAIPAMPQCRCERTVVVMLCFTGLHGVHQANEKTFTTENVN